MKKQWFVYVNGLSDLGSRMQLVAMTGLVLTFENSALWLTVFFAARQVGGILTSLYAGVLADRMDRRKLMMISNVLCGLAIASVVIVPHPWTVMMSAFVVGVLHSVFQVSYVASIPQIFGEDQELHTNARIVRLSALAGIVGFTVGGVLADRFGYQPIILFNAATFMISAVVLSVMHWDSTPEKTDKKPQVIRESREVFAYIWQRPAFLVPSALILAYSLGMTAWNYGLPLLAAQMTEHESTMLGVMWAMVGFGSFIGSYVATSLRVALLPALLITLGAGAVLYTAAFATNATLVVLILLFMGGMVDAGSQLYHRTIMQESDNVIRGRVFGVQTLMNRFGFLAGFAVIPWLVRSFSLLGMVTAINAVVLVVVLMAGYKSRALLSQPSEQISQ